MRRRAFSIWQHKPHQVAPMSDEEHVCQSCDTRFKGNFCPRCGQSARIGRFSFKTAFLLFIDIWGMGNRGMFRSIRDLMLRPGFMIRDYLRGCQSAYFPPFKMFFILATFSLLLSNGFSLDLDTKEADNKTEVNRDRFIDKPLPQNIMMNGKTIDNKIATTIVKIPEVMHALNKKSPALFSLIMLILASAPLYLFIRHCPVIPNLRYSEHIVALVYTANMYTLYSMLEQVTNFGIFGLLAVIMIFVALHQLTGYSKRRLLGYIALTLLICLGVFITIIACVAGIIYCVS